MTVGVALRGHPLSEFNVRVATEGHPYISHGWISPRYGIKQSAPVVSFVSTGEANADFYTLIAPQELSAPLPRFQVLRDSDPLFSGHIRVENFNEVDELSWQTGTEPTWRRTKI